MKKLFAVFLSLSMLLTGCKKVEEMKVKTAEEVYKSAVNYFQKNVENYELELDVDSPFYEVKADVSIDQKQNQMILDGDVHMGILHVTHCYGYVDDTTTNYLFATPLTKYHTGKVDNETIEKIVGLLKDNKDMDVYSMENLTVKSVEFDDDKNLVFHLSYEGNDYDYILTVNIKDDLFKSGTIQILEQDKEIMKINYQFKNINKKIDFQQKWDEILKLEGTSMN